MIGGLFLMTEQEFLALNAQEKADFVNGLIDEGLTLEQISKQHFKKSASWLSKSLNVEGFNKPRGEKHYVRHNNAVELPDELLELLKYKDKLIALATAETPQNKPDVSLVAKFDGEELVPRSFKLPKSLVDEFDAVGAKLRLSKQDLCTLAIAYFVEQYKNQ